MIRRATRNDAEIIAEFNYLMAIETEDFDLDKSVLLDGVIALIGDQHKGQYFLLEKNDEVVGQTLITYEWSDWRNGWIWWVQSVFVKKEYRRQGVFKDLYTHIEAMATQQNVKALRLYVEKENTPAMKTYEELGMVSNRYHMYEKLLTGDK